MKTEHLLSLLLACASLVITAPASLAADAYTPTAPEKYALEFVAAHDNDTGLPAFVENLGLPKADAELVPKIVTVMHALKAKGYVLGKRAFWDEVKKPSKAEPPSPTPTTVQSAPDKNADLAKADEEKPLVKSTVKKAMQEVLEEKEAEANFTSYQSFFNVGANLLTPHKIVPVGASLTRRMVEASSEAEIGGFVEFVYTNRWAWNQDRIQESWWKGGGAPKNLLALSEADKNVYKQRTTQTQSILSFFRENAPTAFVKQFDVQARLGYYFSKDREVTANTLVGSSDMSAELDVSLPLVAHDSVSGAFSVGAEVSYAATTDRSAMDVHHRVFAGAGYTASFESSYASDHKRRVLLHMRLGYASVESVRFLNEETREIHTMREGMPTYFREKALAFETEIFYPIRTHSYLTLGTRIYGGPNPNPWNVYLGLTTPLSGLLDGLLPK